MDIRIPRADNEAFGLNASRDDSFDLRCKSSFFRSFIEALN